MKNDSIILKKIESFLIYIAIARMLTENSYLQVDMLPSELQIGPPGTTD